MTQESSAAAGPGGTGGPAGIRSSGWTDRWVPGRAGSGEASAWWSDAPRDPWRDARSEAVIVIGAPAAPSPPAPTARSGPPAARRGLGVVTVVALASGLLGGALGGAVGYVAAVRQDASAVVIGAGTNPGAPQPPAPRPQRPADSLAATVSRVLPSVVTIHGAVGPAHSIGSGFVITTDGHILTNEHVVAEIPDRGVGVTLSDNTTLSARVVGRDPESDLAVLKVSRNDLPPVEFADSDAVAVGDGVLAMGAPLALSNTVTAGIISALDRTIETHDPGEVHRYYAAIQTDAAVNRGNSGGPLFDMAGRVIGINSVIKSVADPGVETGNIGIAFAIPINQAHRVAAELIDTGRAKRTVLGAELDQTPAATAGGAAVGGGGVGGVGGVGGGVRLTSVDAGGPAAAGGLRSGDVVVRIGPHPVEEPRDLIALVRRYDPGTVVTLVYLRGSAMQTASVTLVADAN